MNFNLEFEIVLCDVKTSDHINTMTTNNYILIFFSVSNMLNRLYLVLGQSWSNANEKTLQNMGKLMRIAEDDNATTTKLHMLFLYWY